MRLSSDKSCDFSNFFNWSFASLLIFLIAIRPSSIIVCTCLTSSCLLSWVKEGMFNRITLPSLFGVKPKSDSEIAFSINSKLEGSNGWIEINWASGIVIFEMLLD